MEGARDADSFTSAVLLCVAPCASCSLDVILRPMRMSFSGVRKFGVHNGIIVFRNRIADAGECFVRSGKEPTALNLK